MCEGIFDITREMILNRLGNSLSTWVINFNSIDVGLNWIGYDEIGCPIVLISW